MRKITRLIIVASLLIVIYNLYVWARTYGLESLWSITDMAPLRGWVLWQYRMTYVIAATIGVTEGLALRRRMAFVGHHRRLWLSSRIAASGIFGLCAAWLTMAQPLALTYVVMACAAMLAWFGFAVTCGFPAVGRTA